MSPLSAAEVAHMAAQSYTLTHQEHKHQEEREELSVIRTPEKPKRGIGGASETRQGVPHPPRGKGTTKTPTHEAMMPAELLGNGKKIAVAFTKRAVF